MPDQGLISPLLLPSEGGHNSKSSRDDGAGLAGQPRDTHSQCLTTTYLGCYTRSGETKRQGNREKAENVKGQPRKPRMPQMGSALTMPECFVSWSRAVLLHIGGSLAER